MKRTSLRFLLFLLILFFLIFNNTTFAATYYVKNNNCSDSNSGSESSPWCHCPGLSGWTGSRTLSAGDTVYFDKGSTWTSSSGYVLRVKGGVQYIGDAWGSGTRAIFRAMANLSNGLVRFDDDHATYETVLKGFEIDANHTASCGVDMNHCTWNLSNPHLTGATKRIQNNAVHDTYSVRGSGQYNYGIIVSSWGHDNSTIVENVEILDNAVYNQSRTGINLYPSWYSGDSVGNVLIRGNEVYDTGQDPTDPNGWGIVVKDYVYNAIIEYNHVHGSCASPGGAALIISSDLHNSNGPTGITVRNNILTVKEGRGVYVASHGYKQIDFYGNIIMNCGIGIGMYLVSDLSESVNMKMYNNTFYNNDVTISTNSASNTIEFKNNIIYGTGRTLLSDPGGHIGTSHNNNVYCRTEGGTLVSSRGSSYSASNLNTYEATGLSSSPLFVNTSNLPTGFTGDYGIDKRPNTDGLSLQSSSPAKDSGANLGSSYNSSINSISRPYGAGWDRSAYEVGAGNTMPSPPSNLRIVLY